MKINYSTKNMIIVMKNEDHHKPKNKIVKSKY